MLPDAIIFFCKVELLFAKESKKWRSWEELSLHLHLFVSLSYQKYRDPPTSLLSYIVLYLLSRTCCNLFHSPFPPLAASTSFFGEVQSTPQRRFANGCLPSFIGNITKRASWMIASDIPIPFGILKGAHVIISLQTLFLCLYKRPDFICGGNVISCYIYLLYWKVIFIPDNISMIFHIADDRWRLFQEKKLVTHPQKFIIRPTFWSFTLVLTNLIRAFLPTFYPHNHYAI